MSSKVNQEFINFINQKKTKINKKNQTEETSTEQDAKDYKSFINKRQEKIKKVSDDETEKKAEKTDSNQNDGSLKALLGMMGGKVLDKVVNLPESRKAEEEDEESNEESESESESDFEEEKINHFVRGIEDIAQYNSESEEESYHEKKAQDNNKEKRQVQCEVFAENIPLVNDEKFIVKFFKKLNNKIVKIKVLKDKDSGKSKGKAFVKFFTNEDAQDLMTKNLKIDKNQITLSMVKKFDSNDGNAQKQIGIVKKNKFEKKQEKKERKIEERKEQFIVNNNKTHTAFIRNLPLVLEESTIIKHFKSFGNVKTVRLIKNKDGKSKGFGYVDFEGQDGLENAIKNTAPMEIEGKTIFIEKAKSSFNENVYEDSKRLGKKKKRTEEKNKNKDN
jgi:RNA recognition motif-containing protein